jgi:Flp pilus assembly protein TadD
MRTLPFPLLFVAACTPGSIAPKGPVETPAEETEAEPVAAVEATPSSPLADLPLPHHDAVFHDHVEEASLLSAQGDPGRALDALRMAAWDMPDSASAWYELGALWSALGHRQRGALALGEALRLDPLHGDALRFAIETRLGTGDSKGAMPLGDRLAKAARDDSRTPVLRGRIFLARAMWEEAIAEGRRAVALNPSEPRAYNIVGFAALQVRRDVLALQYLEAGSELDGFTASMRNNLGIAYERAGRHGDALAAFGAAAQAEPGYAIAAVNRDRVQQLVDRELADAVATMLAARKEAADPPAATAVVEPQP